MVGMTTPLMTIDSITLDTISGGTDTDWIAIGEAGWRGAAHGAVTGLVSGGVAGAAIGSGAAGIGAVPGAVIGAGLGASTGFFLGMDTSMAAEYLRQRIEARRASR
jgi:hypothetical protein